MSWKWFFKIFTRTPAIIPTDPWEGSGSTYVAGFQNNLDRVAQTLSRKGFSVRSRFNREFGYAELYVPEAGIIAHVRVHGSDCAPYEAVITPLSLSKGVRELLTNAFPFPVKFRNEHDFVTI